LEPETNIIISGKDGRRAAKEKAMKYNMPEKEITVTVFEKFAEAMPKEKTRQANFLSEAIYAKHSCSLSLGYAIQFADECLTTRIYSRNPSGEEVPMKDIYEDYEITEQDENIIFAWAVNFRKDAAGVYFEALFEHPNKKNWGTPQFRFLFYLVKKQENHDELDEAE
jgi:hypothetical protein